MDTARPLEIEAVIFDLDGVVTHTASLHASAWKAAFDEFLERRAAERDEPFEPFDEREDYLAYVDGRPRPDGVRGFLGARAIDLPEGAPDDPPGTHTVAGIGRRKNDLFVEQMQRRGVDVFPGTVALVKALREAGIRTAVVTSSRHGRDILAATGLQPLFDAVVDGSDLEAQSLRGKPFPDGFLRGAALLDVAQAHAAVVEDAVAGVVAARRGNFGLVIGVDRGGNRDALLAHGADIVVDDLSELDRGSLEAAFRDARERAAWRVVQDGLDPPHEHAMESLFAVGNGHVGVRGSPDILLPGSQGDLFVAGIYDRKFADRPYSELEFMNVGGDSLHAELVSAPFPFRLAVSVDGEALDLVEARVRGFRRILDLERAMLRFEYRIARGAQAVAIASTRFACAAERHLLLQEVEFRVDAPCTLRVDTTLRDPDLAANHPHLTALEVERPPAGVEMHPFRTQASDYEFCIASRVFADGAALDGTSIEVQAAPDRPIVLRRFVAVHSSREVADPCAAAYETLERLGWEDFDRHRDAHAGRWRERWETSDVRIDGAPATEQALRFNAYHLHSTAARDPWTSIGARALSGRAYEGHIFWDVEVFMLPFYIHTEPAAARNALMYRHHTLPGAKQRSRELGFGGACFAWESTVTGEDVTPRIIRLKSSGKDIPIFTGTEQIHVTADVAYGIWRYWEATHDAEFMRDHGAETLFETARFWTSRVVRGPRGYHIHGVVGPDEYHHSVTDNAYTNWMARFNLEQAVRFEEWLRVGHPRAHAELAERIGLHADEPREWADHAALLHCPQPNADGVIEQFEGFFDLEDYPLRAEERLKAPVHRLFDWDRINQLKLIKQADVLMLPFLFPDSFTDEVVAANYRYYEPLTDHGSSLSPAVHAAIAARIGLHDAARRYWRQSLWLDLSNVMANCALGVHPACMGGTWQALMFGFLGIRYDADGPRASPEAAERMPRQWGGVSTRLRWRGGTREVEVRR